jgi:ubiquitin carboxyl-terminal hydrolase 14
MATIPVTVKWGKQKWDDVQVNLAEPPLVFKAQLFALTGVPPDRQKIMGLKGGLLKDDAPWDATGIKAGMSLMLVGSAEELKGPALPTVFVEDLPPDAQEGAARGLPAGLSNLGNTCYLNSSLQVLRAVPELRKSMQAYSAAPVAPTDNQHQLVKALRTLFVDMSDRTKGSVGPMAFVALFRTLFPRFAEKSDKSDRFAQQDAEEAWVSLVSVLQAKLPAGLCKRLFGFEVLTHYVCPEEPDAAPSTPRSEPQMKLTCNITAQTNLLIEGIRESLTEPITKMSAKLGRDARHTKVSQLKSLPYYLSVQFVRFFWRQDVKGGAKAKILRPVEFPRVLDLFEFCTDSLKQKLLPRRKELQELEDQQKAAQKATPKEPGNKRTAPEEPSFINEEGAGEDGWVNQTGRYELCGVISHKGREADGGHYVGWVRDTAERWILFDDDKVRFASWEDEVKKLSGKGGGDWHIAYLLLYRSRKDL